MQSLDVIIPVYNEECCIDEAVKRLLLLKENLKEELAVNFIFVNDGSSDRSAEILENYAKNNNFIKIINFSRNFGHEMAVTAGLEHSKSDYTAVIDADMQDPPEIIIEMYNKIKDGFDIVYGKRIKREKETLFKKLSASLFYKFLNNICNVNIPADTGDFRIMKNSVVKEFLKCKEKHRFNRGIFAWSGFKSTAVDFIREGRFAGKTKYSSFKLFKLALDAIYSFSLTPLSISGLISGGLFLVSFILAIYMCIEKFALQHSLSIAYPIILVLIILSALQIFILGILGEYIGRIFQEVQNRPLYVIKDTVNI